MNAGTERQPGLVLPISLGERLIADARLAGGAEICGFIASAARTPATRYRVANRAVRTVDRFDMDPADQIAAFRHMRESGLTLDLIYHSHPRGEAEPSAHDRHGHSYPEAAALIIAPAGRTRRLRAWRLSRDTAREIPIDWRDLAWQEAPPIN